MKELKGKVGTLMFDEGLIIVKSGPFKTSFTPAEIITFNFIPGTALTNGSINITSADGRTGLVGFSKKQNEEFEEFFNELKSAIDNSMNKDSEKETIFCSIPFVEYKGGHPSISKETACSIIISNKGIKIHTGSLGEAYIPFSEVDNIGFESIDQIEKRITATRLLLLGPLALAFKKQKKTTEKFFTIDFTNSSNMSSTVLISGKNSANAHALAFRALSNFRTNHSHTEKPNESEDVVEKLKQMKELLDLGILTQDEFDKKKKELLNL